MNKELKNSIDFTNQQVGKKTGFDIPENYFNGIEEKVSTTISSINLPNKNAFKTPPSYFNSIEDDIFNKLNLNYNNKQKEVKVISIRKRILQLVPITAAASILFFIGINYLNTSTKVTFDDITLADVESWYENGYGDTNNEDLAIAFNSAITEDNYSFLSISVENLEDYLNDIDNSDFINEIQ